MYEEAISELKKFIAVYPGNPGAHNNLSVVYYYNAYYKLAMVHYDKALELGYPANPKLLELLKPQR